MLWCLLVIILFIELFALSSHLGFAFRECRMYGNALGDDLSFSKPVLGV